MTQDEHLKNIDQLAPKREVGKEDAHMKEFSKVGKKGSSVRPLKQPLGPNLAVKL